MSDLHTEPVVLWSITKFEDDGNVKVDIGEIPEGVPTSAYLFAIGQAIHKVAILVEQQALGAAYSEADEYGDY